MRADRFRIRKTTAENAALTLSNGRIVEIVDGGGLPTGAVYIHDGSTAGGVAVGVAGAGTGDVVGPASAVTTRIATYNGVTGKLLADGGKTIAELALATHAHAGSDITSGTVDGDRLPAFSTTKRAGVPATGTPSGKYLKDDGTWATVSGAGDVVGPASAVDSRIAAFDGITGKLLKDGGTLISSLSPKSVIDVFVANGTWTKPSGAVSCEVTCIGSGGGGGSGAKLASGTASSGGGGGGGGCYIFATFPASALGATVTVTVHAGGAGGAARTADGSNGVAGSNGGITTFGAHLQAVGGAGGAGGSTGAAAGGGLPADGVFVGTAGGAGAAGAVGAASFASRNATCGGSGGGGGGGISTTPAAFAGGAGSMVAAYTGTAVTGGAVGTTGGNGVASAGYQPGQGGAGGGASITSGNGGNGGNGALYGGGGGGGGADLNGAGTSGAGGNGASGLCLIISYY